jgi:hypothetical protein
VNHRGEILSLDDPLAHVVDELALLVHHAVVLEQILAARA